LNRLEQHCHVALLRADIGGGGEGGEPDVKSISGSDENVELTNIANGSGLSK